MHWNEVESDEKYRLTKIGFDAIHDQKVGAVILSGGQGTRLGFPGPKGMYNMGLPSEKSIFQLHIERILKLRYLSQIHRPSNLPHVPIYIMTSDLNHTVIVDFFKQNNYFKYPSEDIFFFEQGLEPCLTPDGKLIVETPDSLAFAPDGNGGVYRALQRSGALDDMSQRGIEHLHIYGIDNILTKSVDPGFIGLCADLGVQCGNKVVWRASKDEKVGITVLSEGRMHVIEYSEAPPGVADAVDENGKLVYGAANICNHYMSLTFLREVVLPKLQNIYHKVNKKVPCWDARLQLSVSPTQNNAIKLETFIFDVFPFAERFAVMAVEREEEFAPVKNEPGNKVDSPDTARRLLSEQCVRWLHAVGATVCEPSVEEQEQGNTYLVCEISPLLSYGGEGLDHFFGATVTPPCYLTPETVVFSARHTYGMPPTPHPMLPPTQF